MASSSAGYFPTPQKSNSLSSHSLSNHPSAEDSDNDDPQVVLADDPLDEDDAHKLSFKRKEKQPATSKFLSAFAKLGTESQSRHNTRSPRGSTPSQGNGRAYPIGSTSQHSPAPKDGAPLDWYAEGPGRRVGYEDMTAIDWIFEYTKERQRLRILYSRATGLIGYVQQLLDASQIWIVLVLTGLAAGTFAAGIDIATDFLADLKTGYCRAGEDGGHFYLNKFFCCYGYDSIAQCRDWVPWSVASNVRSAGGKWFIEYFFFILFSLSFAFISSVLVKEYALYAKHSGIPEIKTILGGFVIRRFMGIWTLVIKSLGLCLSVASGMWLGKEGPLVHVACCCANVFMKLFVNINGNEGMYTF
ncbi:hypothetical protein sscle_14g099880 [Sclerotinia sclerotiorum 1980 UF-70]|uniref:Uncharacterized protein n=1 Tax=Sclerotinia sclerotiorum (strain ATCC 18683 / 1980 / Ss-1) TaxID=665079 RepID=A0A1D9QJW4_SCLS1|nr:hypothetical protein sscle_14g099880 [Sclerotinia sclerotiorum 1980 UF-70]